MFGAVAEEGDFGVWDGSAGGGIGDPPLDVSADIAADEDGIDDPDDGVEFVAVVHFGGDPPGAGFIQRDFGVGAGVAVFLAGC